MKQPFIGHLLELRRRVTWVAGVIFVAGCLAFMFRSPLLAWLEAPLGQTLYYSRVTGAFEFIVQACLLVGILTAAPLIIYQVIAFVEPALPMPLKRRSVFGLIGLSMGLILAGVTFGYYISLPAALAFLGSIDAAHLQPWLAADSYLRFVMAYLAVFGLVFLLPLVLLVIDHFRPLPPAKLRSARKWVIVGSFGIAVVLPITPDPASQLLLALPVIALYEVGLVAVWLRHRYFPRVESVEPDGVLLAPRPDITNVEPEHFEEPLIEQPTPAVGLAAGISIQSPSLRIADGPRVISLRDGSVREPQGQY